MTDLQKFPYNRSDPSAFPIVHFNANYGIVFDSVSVVDDLITVVFTTSGLPSNAGIQLRLESALYNNYPETGVQVFGGGLYGIPINTTVTRTVKLDRSLFSKKFITGRAGVNPNKINIRVKVTASQPEGVGVKSRYGAGHTRGLLNFIVPSGIIIEPFDSKIIDDKRIDDIDFPLDEIMKLNPNDLLLVGISPTNNNTDPDIVPDTNDFEGSFNTNENLDVVTGSDTSGEIITDKNKILIGGAAVLVTAGLLISRKK